MYPVKIGLTIPGIDPKVFDIPIRIEAYFGAMSKWLTVKPDKEKAPIPTPIVNRTTL